MAAVATAAAVAMAAAVAKNVAMCILCFYDQSVAATIATTHSKQTEAGRKTKFVTFYK